MKKINKITIIILMVAFSVFSCSKDFLEVIPSDKITVDQVFSSKASIEALRIGMYNQLAGKGSPNLYQMLMPLMGDFLGNDMVYGSVWYSAYNAVHQHTSTPESSGVYDVWEKLYYLTEVANTITDNEEKIAEVLGETTAKLYVAEARALRAMAYYDCAKFFGKAYHLDNGASKALPYVDYIDYEALPERNTMAEIYSKAIADLTFAIPILSSVSSLEDKKWMNKNSCYAVLSRIYLDMHEYEMARDNAELSIAGIGFIGTDEYRFGGLSHINDETILGFVLHSDNYYKWRSFNTFHDPWDGMGDDFLANYTLYDLIGTDDVRKKFFWHQWFYASDFQTTDNWDEIQTAIAGTWYAPYVNIRQPKGYYTYGKFPRMDAVFGGADGTLGLGHFSWIRSSEMYLTIAECEARLSHPTEAQDALFMTVSRSIATAVKSTNTGQDLIDEILIERRKELFGEGHGYRDVLRLGNGLLRDGSQPLNEFIPAGSPRFQWPVPQREINANPNLLN